MKRLWKSERSRSWVQHVSAFRIVKKAGKAEYVDKFLSPLVLRASSLIPEDYIVVPPT